MGTSVSTHPVARTLRLGVHVSIAGGLLRAVERATRLSCATAQIFSRSPRGGPAPVLLDDNVRLFRAGLTGAGITPLVVHAPYILNLASPDPVTFKRSVAMYQEEYRRCDTLGAALLVTHVGSHRGEGEEAGVHRVADAINRTLDSLKSKVVIALENTAGSGQGLGYRFEQLAAMRALVEDRSRVGFCLDTAHLFASGYPIHTPDGLEQTVAQCERAIGLKHVKVIHLNDSKSGFESRVDRHWHIGQGQIGLEAMGRIVRHKALRALPMILETPKDSEDDDRRNLATVHRLASQAAELAPRQ